VTNDTICIKFRTDQIADLKKIEKFNQSFVRWAVTQRLENIDEPDAELEEAKKDKEGKKKRRKG